VPGVGLGVLLRTADTTFNRVLRDDLARFNITFSQFQHLWQLFGQDGVSQAEVSRRIGIETASSTSVIEQLESRGLIRRVRDPDDRRRIIVTLTAAGRRLEGALTESAVAVNSTAREGLSGGEIKVLFSVVERIVGNLREYAARSPSKPQLRRR
jgi:DNA-binding MarR family transcriptional regulator